MPTSFLVEFRLQGFARSYARWARERVLREAKRLGVRRLGERRFVPHISLFGPASASSLHNVISEVGATGRKYGPVPFDLSIERGEFQNADANWLYLEVQPSSGLEELRYALAQRMLRSESVVSSSCQSYDRRSGYKFHCSIGKFDTRDAVRFEKLCDFAKTKCSLEDFKYHRASVFVKAYRLVRKHVFNAQRDDLGISQHLLRITVLGKGSRIQGEYDLVFKKLLSRKEALSKRRWKMTIDKFRTGRQVT